MTFATLDLLACVVASGATRFGGFNRLAVDDNDGGHGVLAFCFTHRHDQNADDLFPQTAVTPRVEAVLHGGEGREVLRQVAPRTTCANQIEQGIEDSSRIRRLASGRLRGGQQLLHQRKLLIREVACVALADHRIFLSIGLVPRHGESLVLLRSQRIVTYETGQLFNGLRPTRFDSDIVSGRALRCELPTWMFDESYCAGMTLG